MAVALAAAQACSHLCCVGSSGCAGWGMARGWVHPSQKAGVCVSPPPCPPRRLFRLSFLASLPPASLSCPHRPTPTVPNCSIAADSNRRSTAIPLAVNVQVTLFHRQACEACGDSLLDLLDWAHRRLVWLQGHKPPAEVTARTPEVCRCCQYRCCCHHCCCPCRICCRRCRRSTTSPLLRGGPALIRAGSSLRTTPPLTQPPFRLEPHAVCFRACDDGNPKT